MADIQPIFLGEPDRESIRAYLEASKHHAMSNADALNALDSIDALQRTLKQIEAYFLKCEEIDPDLIMTWIKKPYTQLLSKQKGK